MGLEPALRSNVHAFRLAIRDGNSQHPTFETAVELHRLVDAIKQASDNGRAVTFA
jgi:predicted dehydrogenase